MEISSVTFKGEIDRVVMLSSLISAAMLAHDTTAMRRLADAGRQLHISDIHFASHWGNAMGSLEVIATAVDAQSELGCQSAIDQFSAALDAAHGRLEAILEAAERRAS